MAGRAPGFSIILAAGKGTRMRVADRPKVCFAVDGRPAINRAIETYNACGIRRHIVVVGALAGQVVETVGGEFDNVSFAYQPRPQGTADAARVGLRALEATGDGQDLLLVAGDRIIEQTVLEQLFDVFYTQGCDLALLACPTKAGSGQGRLVESAAGELLGIVEVADIRQRQVFGDILRKARSGAMPAAAELVDLMRSGLAAGGPVPSDSKLATAFGELWQAAAVEGRPPTREELDAWVPEERTQFRFRAPGGDALVMTPSEVLAAPLSNNSVYMVTAAALRYALERLDRRNAQNEEYLSDLAAVLAAEPARGRPFRMRALRVTHPEYVMGFNDPAELLVVEEHIRSRRQDRMGRELAPSAWFREVRLWQDDFRALAESGAAPAGKLWDELVTTYGDDADVLVERLQAYRTVLDHAAGVLGPRTPALIVRSAGRVNVMGRHVDRQGGHCNLMTIGRETLMVVSPRRDDRICLHNLDKERFGSREFSIGELVADLPWDDWLSLVNSEKVSAILRSYGGDWSQYVVAAVLRLQKKFSHVQLRGMDVVVSGNIPMAAGLSSSSSLVVGAAEATIAVNRLDTFPAQLVDLCGEGEWFVGTRGGSADHAAVKLGQKGKVIKVTFFDFAVQDVVSFPDDYVMAICNSGIKAQKSANAKDQFNHRIACYRIGFKLIRQCFPQYAPLIHHLRDVNTRNLGVPLSWIYKILLHLPEVTTREELREMLPGDEELDTLFATHAAPEDGVYPIRGIVLFGLAECARSSLYADWLKAGRIEDIGRMMNASHDGDRVAVFTADGELKPYRAPTSNGHLLSLMEDCESGDPERVLRAQLPWQPGRYYCSLPAIDKMVDVSLRTNGVVGAQLAGAGLGGCMMVLARREAVQDLVESLTRHYYDPERLAPAILVCSPIAGAGILQADAP